MGLPVESLSPTVVGSLETSKVALESEPEVGAVVEVESAVEVGPVTVTPVLGSPMVGSVVSSAVPLLLPLPLLPAEPASLPVSYTHLTLPTSDLV